MGRISNKYRIMSTGILLGLVAVIYMVGLRKDLFLERGETKKCGQETLTVVDMEEEEQSPWLLANDKGLEETDTEAGRMYPPTNPVGWGVGFLACKDIVTSRENENPGVPEELTQTLSTALQNNSLEDCVAGISASYVLLQEGEIMQYIREDTSGILESFYYDYSKGGEEWFLFERDNDIIVRQEIDNET